MDQLKPQINKAYNDDLKKIKETTSKRYNLVIPQKFGTIQIKDLNY